MTDSSTTSSTSDSAQAPNAPPVEVLSTTIRESVIETFEEKIPFNKHLGLRAGAVGLDRAVLSWHKKPEQVGNYVHGILHGGVISSALDAAGGLMAMIHAMHRVRHLDPEKQAAILSRIGTIDLRVDFLRRGTGEAFHASAYIMRAGSRVAVTRMELHNEKDTLLATGTGTYIVG